MSALRNWRAPSAPQIAQLVNAALGKAKADLAIVNGNLLNVYTGELLPGYSVAIKGERIAFVGPNAGHIIGANTQVIDAAGAVLIPGFIDTHIHLAYYYSPYQFLRYSMKGGTTTLVTETMEIAFFLGYRGTVSYLAAIRGQPIKVLATAPPLVTVSPATEARALSRKQMARLLSRPDILGLGETYWLPVIQGQRRILDYFAETMAQGKRLVGHASGARGDRLVAYAAAGVSSCHESITSQEALDKLRLGLHVIIRQGSVRQDLAAVSKMRDEGIDRRRICLGSDNITPEILIEKGHMEHIVQRAIDLGWPPVQAIQMATINAAECFGLADVLGAIAPGKYADIVLIPDLHTVKAKYVISNGKVIARDGQLLVQPRRHIFPSYMTSSFKVGRPLTPEDFAIPASIAEGQTKVRVIDCVTELVTRETQVTMPVKDGGIKANVDQDILKVMMMDADRPFRKFVGLVRGFKLRQGAFATSQVWDCAGIVVVGSDEQEMAAAANRVIELRGGVVIYAGGQIQAELPLPLGGFFCELPMETLAQKLAHIQSKAAELGCPFPDAHLALTVLTTPAIPYIRISEAGLVNIRDSKMIRLVVD